jgi:radical SAM protein with 4Fe4S-binding SPASM domain
MLATAACACGVWNDQGETIDLDPLLSALEQLRYSGVERLVVRGGEPFLEPDRLFALLSAAAEFGLSCEVHTTGTLIEPAHVEWLRLLPVDLVLLIAGRDSASFEKNTGVPGSWNRLQCMIEVLRSAGISFFAKVPAALDNWIEAQEVSDWAHKVGAAGVFYLTYLPEDEYSLAEFREITGPKSPAEMAVTLQQFMINGQSQFCYHHRYFIAADGRVTPCIAQRRATADLKTMPMSEILRKKQLSYLRNSARNALPACGSCEFRFGCSACLVRTEQIKGSAVARHWNCHFDPENAVWE